MDWKNEYTGMIVGIPLFAGFCGYLIPVKGGNVTANKNITPPGGVFGIAWTILYICITAAFIFLLDEQKDSIDNEGLDLTYREYSWIIYPILLAILLIWPWVYNNSKANATYLLFISIVATFIAYSISPSISKVLLSPLLGWLSFAGLLSFRAVVKE